MWNPRKPNVVRVVPITLAFACIAVLVGHAQRVPFRAQLRLHLTSFSMEYGDRPALGQGVVFVGEPLIVELGIANRYEGGPPAAAEVDWPSRIVARTRAGGRFDSGGVERALICELHLNRDHNANANDSYVELLPDGYQYFKCAIDPTKNGLTPGLFTLVVEWSAAAIAPERFLIRTAWPDSLRVLRDELEFELREPLTDGDRLDLLVHLANHASLDGRHDDGVRYVDQLLGYEPNSVTGWLTRGRLAARAGRCADANVAFDLAGAAIQRGQDLRSNWLRKISSEERRRNVVGIQEEARQLGCR